MSEMQTSVGMKVCRVCGTEKPHTDFSGHPYTKDRLRGECRPCATKLAADWRARNPEKVAEAVRRYATHRKKRYAEDQEFRETVRASGRRYYESLSPEEKRRQGFRNALITNYGMTVEQYEALLAKQNGLCAICGKQPKKPEVDHDHATGAVRGILCRKCNTGIGLLGDSPEGLVKALTYLRNH